MADDTQPLPPWVPFVDKAIDKQTELMSIQNRELKDALSAAVDRLVTKDAFEAERRLQEKEAELAADRLRRAEESLREQIVLERKAREDADAAEATAREDADAAETKAREQLAAAIARQAEQQRSSKRFLWTGIITVATALIVAGATLASYLIPHVAAATP